MEQEIKDTIQKIKSPWQRLVLYIGFVVISTLFGMYIKTEMGYNNSQSSEIKRLNTVLEAKDKKIEDLNLMIISFKEAENQRLIRGAAVSDSINRITNSMKNKINALTDATNDK